MGSRGRRLRRVLPPILLFALLPAAAQGAAGALDPTFSGDGKVTTPVTSSEDDVAHSVALQDDGRIVVAGYSDSGSGNDFALARYNPDGSLDESFASNGIATLGIGATEDVATAVALQDDGKIVVAGYFFNGLNYDMAVVRYNADGGRDMSFDGDGIATTTAVLNSNQDQAFAVALQSDGKIILAGHATYANNDLALVRFKPDGSIDTTFDGDGIVTTVFGPGNEVANGVVIQDDGRIVAAGYSHDGSNYDFALARYHPDGTPDTSFDSDGKVTTPIGPGSADFANGVALQDDGRIVVAGSSGGIDGDFALARYNPDGSLDTAFDSDGKVTTPIGSSTDQAYGVALQDDDRIVAAGFSFNGSDNDFALARYLGRTSRSTTLVSSAKKRVFDQRFSLSGLLASSDPICVGGASVRIARDVVGGAVSFKAVKTVTADADGDFSLKRTADRSARYKATALATDSCDAASATKTVKVKKKVSLKASRSRVAEGSEVRLTAAVAPCKGHERKPVVLQRKTASGFVKVAEEKTSRKCTAVFEVALHKTTIFRALAPKTDADHLAGVSPSRKVRVF